MLCFRCEHRAKFLESGRKPRHQCGKINKSNIGCYMFRPCKPIVMQKNQNDPRVVHGGYLGARMIAIKLANNCVLKETKGNWLQWVEK